MSAAGQAKEITHRRVFLTAFPIVLSNATVPILGAVDTGVVGQLGEAAPIGAVGIGATIITFFYWAFGFLRMGTAGMAAQAIGARDHDEVTALLVRGLLIAAAAGIGIFALQIPLFWLGFQVSPASQDVENLARDYMSVRVWGAPAAIGAYAITGWLVAAERTREVLILQLWINGLNIVLDIWFVLGLGWGVEGVALATIIAEWSGLTLGLWMCRAAFTGTAWKDRTLILMPDRLKKMAVVNTDIMIRSVLLLIGFSSFTMRGAAFDDVTLAANQILIQFLFITAHAMDGFAFASEALIGNAMGAKDRKRLRRAAIIASQWSFLTVCLLAVIFWLFGQTIIDVMTTSPDVRLAAYTFLIWMVIAPPLGMPSWILDGIFIGATRTRDMRNAMIVSLALYLVALATLPEVFGNHGLWAALILFFIFRGATLARKYPALEAAAER
ncbi:MAG: MATE family efflux transporter [Pseudomonadota bacterium]